MSEFPKGWETAEIGDLCNLINGRAFKSQEWADSGLPIIRIQNLNSQKSKFNYFSGDLDSKHLISKGDLLFAWSGTPGTSFGAHVWHGPDAALNQHIFKIEFSEECVGGNFLRYAIDQKLDELIGSAQGGVGLRHVTKGTFEKTAIAFPPRAEQTRITQKLDELLAQVDTLKARIDAIPTLFKRFRQSVLAAAVSGRLTEEWRESNRNLGESAEDYLERIISARRKKPIVKFKEPVAPDVEKREISAPESWVISSVSSFAECLDSMRVPVKKELRSSGKGLYPYFGANGEVDRVDEYIFDEDLVLVTEDETFYGREKPIAYKHSGKCWVNNHVHALRTHDLVARDYLCYALMHYDVFPWLTGTTGRAKLTQGALLSLPIQVPPPAEQIEIVRRVEQFFAFADQVEAKVALAKSRIDHLTQSILAKAFRGELVPQDPNDEPASVLLERIQAQRAAAPKAKRGRKNA